MGVCVRVIRSQQKKEEEAGKSPCITHITPHHTTSHHEGTNERRDGPYTTTHDRHYIEDTTHNTQHNTQQPAKLPCSLSLSPLSPPSLCLCVCGHSPGRQLGRQTCEGTKGHSSVRKNDAHLSDCLSACQVRCLRLPGRTTTTTTSKYTKRERRHMCLMCGVGRGRGVSLSVDSLPCQSVWVSLSLWPVCSG